MEEAIGYIGALPAQWSGVVKALVAKGRTTHTEILGALEAEASARRATEEFLVEKGLDLETLDEDDLDEL